MALDRPDYAREVRAALTDAVKLCTALQLTEGAKRQASGLLIRCPSHGERDPSCSVTPGRDGTLRAKCFACDWTADALGIIALVRGLDVRRSEDFRDVLVEGAEIGGHMSLAAEILDGQPKPERTRVEPPKPRDDRTYAPQAEVQNLWNDCMAVYDTVEVSAHLVFRAIDPELIGARNLARAIPDPQEGPLRARAWPSEAFSGVEPRYESLPAWARYNGNTWLETGHKLLVRTWDANGVLRGVRAMRVRDGESPKRLPPAGHKAAELCMLNRAAWDMCRGAAPGRVVVVEGEPDWAIWATRIEEPVIGIVSGSWTDQWAAVIPRGAKVIIRTHSDAAGDRYAEQIAESLSGKCDLRRSEPEYS